MRDQTAYIISKCVDAVRDIGSRIGPGSSRRPTFPAWCKGCAEKALDITQGGAEINFTTLEAVTYATTVDSLLAIKYLVFDQKRCSMAELIAALKANWAGLRGSAGHGQRTRPPNTAGTTTGPTPWRGG